MARVLAILGSGETSPTMIKTHRSLMDRAGDGPAVILDTPFGFQENADDIVAKAQSYFAASVGRPITLATLRRPDIVTQASGAATFDLLRRASYVFAGPGSPTYALRVWESSPVPEILATKLTTGEGVVAFSSAAALTLGVAAVPVYEIYKTGAEPFWLPGLDILRAATGLSAAVIPHYNNAEGGHHDTRFCYVGETRLRVMEALLPADAFVLGVDEHTGLILDLDAQTAAVAGVGVVTIRKDGVSREIASCTTCAISDLVRSGESRPTVKIDVVDSNARPAAGTLAATIDRLTAAFDRSLDAAAAETAADAALELEQAIHDWSLDTLQSDDLDRARERMRSMIARLAFTSRAAGAAAPAGAADVIGVLVEALLSVRTRARAAGDFAHADEIRAVLTSAGIEIRDAPSGTEWIMAAGV